MNRNLVTRRAPRLLLLVTVAATAVVFLAPTAQAVAGLTVTKTADPADASIVTPGDTVTYTVVVGNPTGPGPATSLTFTDPTPTGTSYVADSATVNSVTVAGASNPFDSAYPLLDLGMGLSHTMTFEVTVNSPLPDASTITNTASASSPDDSASPVTDATTHTVNSAPSLTVDKTASPTEGGSVAPGDTLTYSVVVGNAASATDDATGVSLTDPLPADTTYVADSATEDGNPILGASNPFETGYTLTDSTLAPGEDHTLAFDVLVDGPPLLNGTVITNTATASATNGVDTPDTVTHTVASAPGLVVDKTASPAEGGPVAPGDTITYTIALSNDPLATDTATTVELTDPTPANTTYVADSATVDAAPEAGATNPFETGYAFPDMAPGDSHTVTFQVLVDPVVDNGTVIANTATLDSDQGSASNNATHTVASQSTLTLVKTATPAEGGPVTPGTKISYSMLVSNDATANEVADQLVLTDPTPADTAYVGSSAAVDGTSIFGDENPLGSGLDLPDLAPGESVTVTYDVIVNKPLASGTVISNLATLTADNHPDLSDEATHTVDSSAVMKVEVTASPVAGSQVQGGQTIAYTVKVSNDAAATAVLKNVSVTETPPAGTTYVPSAAKAAAATASGSMASPTAYAVSTDEPVVVLSDPTELVNYIWWLVAHSQDPSEYMAQALGTALALNDGLDGVAPHSILLAVMTKAQLGVFLAAHPEASEIIGATLAMYDEIRPLVLYMIGHHQVSLGLATAAQVPYLHEGGVVLQGALAEAELAEAPLASAATATAAETSIESTVNFTLGDIAPGASATVSFGVTVSASASGELKNTATVAAANHPTVVATTTHMAPQSSGGGGGGGNRGGGGGDGSGGVGDGGTTTSLESTSSGAAGESLAFTGLDLARLLLLALSLLLAGWVLISRGRVLQRRAVAGSHRGYEVPETRFLWDGAWFYPSRRK